MKKTEKNQISAAEQAKLRKIIANPLLFATNIIGTELWKSEIEILRSIQKNRQTAVKSAHGLGKTYTLAIAALWWLARFPDGIVLTTAPTFRQVKTQLWSQIHRVAGQSLIPFPQFNTTDFKLRGDENFAMGISTNRAVNLQGYHGPHVLIVADEATGISAEIWDAIHGITAGGKVHIVMAGNPTVASGAFFDAFTRERALWNCITVDAFDSPNLVGLTLEQLLQLDPREGGPLDDNPIPYLATKRWVFERYQAWWRGDERSSPVWMSRVRGEFPEQDKNALIKQAWLERARQRAGHDRVALPSTDRTLVAGVDVGGGESETAVYVCDAAPGHYEIVQLGAWRGEDNRGQVVNFLERFRNRLASVRVDSVGIGYNFALHLQDQGFDVEHVNVGLSCPSQPELGANDPAKRFVNEKAWRYQNLADVFEHDQIDGPTDDTTIAQLAGLLFELDSHGRLRIESKDKARQRGVASPDRAEALMLAIGKPREPVVPEHIARGAAVAWKRDGFSEEFIAQKSQVSVEKVREWLREANKPTGPQFDFLYRKTCAYCHEKIKLSEPGEPLVQEVREGDRYYHEICWRRFTYGPNNVG